jgi:hypothetical protein
MPNDGAGSPESAPKDLLMLVFFVPGIVFQDLLSILIYLAVSLAIVSPG